MNMKHVLVFVQLKFDPVKGVMVNDKPVRVQGVNQHHDLGALGAAFNMRAAERQFEILARNGMQCHSLWHTIHLHLNCWISQIAWVSL